ncbi:hypothetical protein B2A_12565, partial [mine drainage metagenome]
RREWVAHSGFPATAIRFCRTPEEALAGADAAVVHTPWPAYRAFSAAWVRTMRSPLVIDLRRALPGAMRRRSDVVWVGLGASPHAPPEDAMVGHPPANGGGR